MALQYLDEGFHPVLLLNLFDKIKAPEIDRPFNDRFRIGPVLFLSQKSSSLIAPIPQKKP